MTPRIGFFRPPSRRTRSTTHSLRSKLTLINVVLLALGITIATAVTLFGLRHYLLEAIDTQLTMSRDGLQRTELTINQIESLSSLATIVEKISPREPGGAGALPTPDSVFVAVDERGRAIDFAGVAPSRRQLDLARAVTDPASLSQETGVRELKMHGDPYRVVGARLSDGSTVLISTSTKAVQESLLRALKFDAAFGGLLLVLLALITLMSANRTLRPLGDMVETATAIAEGDLTRRVPGRHDPVTEIEQLRLALNAMLQQVESAYVTRERSTAQLRRFVADASHELRTPLSAIRGYLQLYEKGMLGEPAERSRAVSRMSCEADRMARLVEELLTLARLDQRPVLRLRPVDLSRLVRDAAEDLRAQQPDRPLDVSAAGAMLVQADESGLRQVLGNLLTNIRTHTPADAPVRLELRRSEGGEVRLCVSDEGPGMSDEDAARIFDRFFRAGGGAAGSGLGMSIVQAVVRSHGGDVSVRTSPGTGLSVTVTLPS
ncbi:HAMP domain-containing histidine kinase [Streptomyces niveus]|uniref:sensor histidine kinase n=1 Tax=Streptomyces niveus TaxID=193462 RepID=UPI002E350F6C|nr:HAMP domain-containing sensor histidine kinase [Streptomyces niveus]